MNIQDFDDTMYITSSLEMKDGDEEDELWLKKT
jgi:hypothetical protein